MYQTWPFKDLNAKPKKGRYFPITFAETVHAAKRWGMLADAGKRVRIQFYNPKGEEAGDLVLLSYAPGELLVLESWPDSISPEVARFSVARAFPILSLRKRLSTSGSWANQMSGRYLVLRSNEGNLKLVERLLHFQQPKYRGNQKFSNAFKSRLTRIEDHVLPIPNHLEPDEELVGKKLAA